MATIPVFTLNTLFNNPSLPVRTVLGFIDSFDRPEESPLSVTSGEAKPWVHSLATGLTSGVDAWGRAYFRRVAGGAAQAVVEANTADGTLESSLSALAPSGLFGLAFRWSEPQNYFNFAANMAGAGYYRLNKVAGNVTTALATSVGVKPAPGDRLSVVLAGSSIRCYVNDVQLFSVSDAHNVGATRHGLYNTDTTTTARWEQISFTPA